MKLLLQIWAMVFAIMVFAFGAVTFIAGAMPPPDKFLF